MKWLITLFLILSLKSDYKHELKKIQEIKIKTSVKVLPKKEIKKVIFPIQLKELANFIKSHEGLVLKVYRCPGGYRTIGYGHSLRNNENYDSITQNQADSLLYSDIKKAINFVNSRYDSLSNNKKLALTHFVYAVGCGNLVKSELHNKVISDLEIKNELLKWSKIKGKFSNELYKQRQWELKRFYNE
jgi:lysozyme